MIDIYGVKIPDSSLAREVTEIVRDMETELLFNHSIRTYLWAALTGVQRGIRYDPELLYTGAMFHDFGLTKRYCESQLRFEVDGANAARDFLRSHGVPEVDVKKVWEAIALHTTPGIPEYMDPEIALVQAGAAMDLIARGYDDFSDEQRKAVISAYPRGGNFEHEITDFFYQGLKHRPDSTFGTMNEDFLAHKDPTFQRLSICSAILDSRWAHHECHTHGG